MCRRDMLAWRNQWNFSVEREKGTLPVEVIQKFFIVVVKFVLCFKAELHWTNFLYTQQCITNPCHRNNTDMCMQRWQGPEKWQVRFGTRHRVKVKVTRFGKNWTKWVRSSVEVLVFASSLSEVECRGLKNSVKLGLFEESSSETSSEVEFLTLF